MALTSEDAILSLVDRYFPRTDARLMLHRGDDCCAFTTSAPLCVSTDLFIEDVHFRRSTFTPHDIGWKALAVNLSDLAACGASPLGFSLGLALPADADEALVDGMFAGMAELAEATGAILTGGDISRADKLHLCVTVFGEVAPEGLLRRGVCHPGDVLFLVGRVGLSRTGLAALEKDGRNAMEGYPVACAAHLRPEPRLRDGMRLAALQAKHHGRLSLMDVSDGLAKDLPRLLGAHGADISLTVVPEECRRWAEAHHLDATLEAVRGGEDYALVGTCEPAIISTVMAMLPEASLLGTVTKQPGVRLEGAALCGGFDHFMQQNA